MATKKVTKAEQHEPTKAFDWQLYAEELEKECERVKRTLAQTQDYVNDIQDRNFRLEKAVTALTTALYYINGGADNE